MSNTEGRSNEVEKTLWTRCRPNET